MIYYYNTNDSTTAGTYTNYYNNFAYYNSTSTASENNWNFPQTTSTTIPYGHKYFTYYSPPVHKIVYKQPSEEELLKIREAEIKAAEEAKKARVEAEEAARKARLLLTEYLDNENRIRMLNKEPLEVPSRLFEDIKYHIPISNGRIKALKENKVITELCLTVKDSRNLPTDDIVLTKFLHVLHDEENMLRTANHFNKEENLLSRLN